MNVKTLCLGALTFKDGTGYDIKKLFEAAFSHFHTASYGSIYPSLGQLESEGLVSLRVEPGERHPKRKVYSITGRGREAFLKELVRTEPAEQLRSELMALLFFAHLLPTERLAAVLDRAAAAYRDHLAYLESIRDKPCHTAGIHVTIEMGIAALQAKLRVLESEREALLRDHNLPPAEPGEEES